MSFNYNIFDNNTEVSNTSKKTKTFYSKASKRQFSRYTNDSSNHLLNDRKFTSDNFYNIIN